MVKTDWRLVSMATRMSVVYLLLLLFLLPLATLHHHRGKIQTQNSVHLAQEENESLRLLKSIKRRIATQLQLQEAFITTITNTTTTTTTSNKNNKGSKNRNDNLNALATIKRRTRDCRNWNDPCVPWSNDSDEMCCNQRRLVCHCNLWMQNCRCVSRAWGK